MLYVVSASVGSDTKFVMLKNEVISYPDFKAFSRVTDVKLTEKLSSKLSNRVFVSHFHKIDM